MPMSQTLTIRPAVSGDIPALKAVMDRAIKELLPAFLTSLLVCVVVSLVTPAPSKEIEAEFEAAK